MIARSTFAYSSVSALCFLLHNTIMIGGDWLDWSYFFSILLSFCLSATTGYLLHSLVTFGEPVTVRRFLRYSAAMTVNIPLAVVATWIWHDVAGLAMMWASPIATICMIGVNFLLSRWAIVSKPTRTI